jgi:hypothetical protein
MSMNEHTPQPFPDIIDRVTDADRDWFAKHPRRVEYERNYQEGEIWPCVLEPPPAGWRWRIHVRFESPTMRWRTPVLRRVTH